MTSAPSTPSPDQLTLFAGDFPAKTSAKPERVPAWLAADRACSTNCSESFAWWDRATSSWKTSQRSLAEEWTTFSERWPRQGMTRNGRAYRQRLWVPVISGTGGGALPTPVAQTGAGGPRAAGAPGRLPTPRTCSAMAAPVNSRGNLEGERFPNLETVIGRMLPTPQARDHRIGSPPGSVRWDRKAQAGWSPNLNDIAAQLLTPCANDWKGRTNWEAAKRHGPQRLPDCLPTGAAINLNPSFVEE